MGSVFDSRFEPWGSVSIAFLGRWVLFPITSFEAVGSVFDSHFGPFSSGSDISRDLVSVRFFEPHWVVPVFRFKFLSNLLGGFVLNKFEELHCGVLFSNRREAHFIKFRIHCLYNLVIFVSGETRVYRRLRF